VDLLDKIFFDSRTATDLQFLEVIGVSFMSFLLVLVVGYTYRITHRGPSYSQSSVHTMVIMAVVVALIMKIIGTNIAGAFTLVGALSIIRFRNAVKDSRNLAFYFLSMSIGMACGTGFAAIGAVYTFCVCPMIYFMARFDIGAKEVSEVLLKPTVGDDVQYNDVFSEVFFKYLENADLLSVDSDGTGTLELIHTVTLRRGAVEQGLLSGLQGVDGAQHAQLIHGHNNFNL